jgi:hypothetical protein
MWLPQYYSFRRRQLFLVYPHPTGYLGQPSIVDPCVHGVRFTLLENYVCIPTLMVDRLCMYLSRGTFVWAINVKGINKEASWMWIHQKKLATTTWVILGQSHTAVMYISFISINVKFLFQYTALVYRLYCYFNVCGHSFSSGTPEVG